MECRVARPACKLRLRWPLPPTIQQFGTIEDHTWRLRLQLVCFDRMVAGKNGVGNGAGVSNHRHPLGGRQQGGRWGATSAGRYRSVNRGGGDPGGDQWRGEERAVHAVSPAILHLFRLALVVSFLSGTAHRVTHTHTHTQAILAATSHGAH